MSRGIDICHSDNVGLLSPYRTLVIGGTGLIGAALVKQLALSGQLVVATSRRAQASTLFLAFDLVSCPLEAMSRVDADVVFICAGITAMRACEADPFCTAWVNVEQSTRLARYWIERGAFVIFLSSNTVFSCREQRSDETSPLAPVTQYGAQKAQAELAMQAIEGASTRLAIARLSKVVSRQQGMAAEFIEALRTSSTCRAFSDLNMSPTSIDYVVSGLLHIAGSRTPGVFHLSGSAELSYADFAAALAVRLGVEPAKVEAISSSDAGVKILFRPRFPALGMSRTTRVLNLLPEPIEQVLDRLLDDKAPSTR
jgi:dTDP-4-dehydrorhamnose reductase